MHIWQADFYHLPSQSEDQQRQWELIICESPTLASDNHPEKLVYTAQCSSANANPQWLEQQILSVAKGQLPDKIQIFRPQSLGLLTVVAEKLGIEVEATRNTEVLKQVLTEKYNQQFPNHNPLALDQPPPQALPENIWGDQWQIANIAAGQIVDLFRDRPIPICHLPESFLPLNLGIAHNIMIPGIVVYGGRKTMQIARWIEQENPAYINYIPTEVGKSGGFILETGLVDRWVFNTFESEQATRVAQDYEQKKQVAKGLHFLLIQPDDSGMTYTAFWLLKA
ncbi:Tab2/Atab2 family RNA-binding protein [Pleurocapsa sp. PCC 7319]|uniref:Tab2/Atab2 family RNA-binding protein n=1 Tax=Pleurocapsa sp. PCC 7319 TaxID=118161 RepID=UPI000347F293|nr:Tab2/Atab2 family RNA-binding protein [Pleurocapsa sp. PCC 7319]